MDWLWPIYRAHVERERERQSSGAVGESELFMQALAQSTATLFVMEPKGDSIRFKGLGRWPLADVPGMLADPHGFIAERFGGGKYKVNFHHQLAFVGTHNFKIFGEPRWTALHDVELED